jgi:hypothetical protein
VILVESMSLDAWISAVAWRILFNVCTKN